MKNSVEVGSRAVNLASYALIGSILTFIMTGISLVIVTRILGPSQYGIYTLAIAFGGIFGSIGGLVIGSALSKFISELRESGTKAEIDGVLSNGLFLIAAVSLIIVLFCALLNGTLSQYVFHTETMGYLIEFVAVEVVAVMFYGVVVDALVGFGNGKRVAIVATLEALVQASVSIFLAVEGFGVLAPLFGLIVAYVISVLGAVYILRRYNRFSIRRPSLRFIKKILYFSTPLAISNIGSSLASNAALIFLGYFVLPSVIGNVGITSKTGALVGVVLTSISLALLPAFSVTLANKKLNKDIGRIYGYAVYLAVAVVGPLLFYMAVFSSPFSYLFFGNSYAYAPLYISIMCIGLLVGVAGSYANTLLISAHKVFPVLKYNILISVVVLLLVVALVPALEGLSYQFLGVSYGGGGISYVVLTFLISPIITSILFVRKLGATFKIDLKFNKMIRLGVADVIVSAFALPVYLVLGGIALLVAAAVIYLLLYPIAAALVGGVDRSDINTIKALSNSIPFVGWALRFMMDYSAMVLR